MRIVIYLIGAFALLYLGSFTYMSIDSRRPRSAGLFGGRLRECPGTPNCVVSEYGGNASYIEPIAYSAERAAVRDAIKRALLELGGRIEKEDGDYLWATFRSRFWGFVDDLELRMDGERGLIHVRSASRVGKGDLGVNRKRVEKLRSLFNKS